MRGRDKHKRKDELGPSSAGQSGDLQQLSDVAGGHRPAALAGEQVGAVWPVPAQLAQKPELRTAQRVGRGDAVLQACQR